MKRCLCALTAMLMLAAGAGCAFSGGTGDNSVADALQQAIGSAQPSITESAVPDPAQTVPDQTPDAPVSTEAPANGPVLCYVLFDADTDGPGFTLLLDDIIWVSSDDTELIEKYGLQDAYFDDDYELYDEDPTYRQQFLALDFSTVYVILTPDDGDASYETAQVSADEFINVLRSRDWPMLAYITFTDGSPSRIEEVYVP